MDRDFTAAGPGQKWVTDVTEFRVGDQNVYLSPLIDPFDRSVVAHSWSRPPGLELTNSSIEKALATLSPGQRPLGHSDQGFQYQHRSWRTLLESAGAAQSMSRKATCLDNAVAETSSVTSRKSSSTTTPSRPPANSPQRSTSTSAGGRPNGSPQNSRA